MDRLVSARHPGAAGARLPRGGPSPRQRGRAPKGGAPGLLPLTVPEVRRLLLALAEPPERFGFRLGWSRFRRRHQATAKRCHAARRARRRAASTAGPTIHDLPSGHLEPTDGQWAHVAPLLPPQRPPTGRPNHDHRTILAGMLWVARTGSSWRDLPERFGPWQTVHGRYTRWRKAGIWQQVLDALEHRNDPKDP